MSTPFPAINEPQTWAFAIGPNHINLSDGNQTYSFLGELADRETSIQKTTDVPLADFYMAGTKRGEIQVYRADAKAIHFSILDGVNNPTYTFVHQVETRWTVIPENPYKTQGKARAGISLPPGKKQVQ